MRRSVRKGLRLVAVSLVAILPRAGFSADSAHPTVVELFQSQGCSDCPPAAAHVAALSDRPDILALGFSVDYWDRLGWKDVFAKPQYTARQHAYARALGLSSVYTPQVVINGRVEGTGLEAEELAGLIRRGDRGSSGPTVEFSGTAVSVGAAGAPTAGADVWLARYNPGTLEVAVRRGENAGRTLPQKNVVREMVLIGHWRGEAATLSLPPASEPDLAEAAIVQEVGGGKILAAAKR